MLSDRFEFEMFPSVSLFGKIIPMYGLCMVLGIILSCSVAFARAKKFRGRIDLCENSIYRSHFSTF